MASMPIAQKYNINRYSALTFICLFLLCIPRNESAFPLLCTALKFLQTPCFLWAIYVFFKTRTILNKWLTPMWVLLIVIVMCSLVQQPEYAISAVVFVMRIFSVVVFSEYLLKNNILTGVNYIATIWSFAMLIQGFSFFTHCFGVTQSSNISIQDNYYFGIRNDINQYIIYTIAFVWIAVPLSGFSKTLAIISTAISIYFTIAESVSTSLTGLAIFGVIVIFAKILKSERIWRGLLVFLLIGITVFIVGQKTRLFIWLIQDVLKKDLTMTGRTELWSQVFSQMTGMHWLFGYGFDPPMNFHYEGMLFNHPHNQYLQMLYNFGVFGLVFYLLLLINMITQIRFIKNPYVKRLHLATLISSLVMCIASRNFFYFTAPMYYVLVCYLPEIKVFSYKSKAIKFVIKTQK